MPDDKNVKDRFCPTCGLKKTKQSAPGRISGYVFDPVRCKCAADDGEPSPGATLKIVSTRDQTFASLNEIDDEEGGVNLHLDEGTVIGGNYSIVKLIGYGGMGVVYEATHLSLAKRCAIKLIPPDQVTSTAWSRFQIEAKSVARLEHKNIVKVTDLGLHKGYMPFYAMEYIEGVSLAEKLAREKRLDLQETLNIFIQVCDGVDYAHRAGLIHRDLKPANIMIAGENVKILDFGLAKLAHTNREEQSLTAVGDIFGSPYYMSPEQCEGEKVDNRSDIYSLGCALFESLAGRPPFDGTSSTVMRSQQVDPPPSLESVLGKNKMPEAMEIILAKLLRKNPVERYQTCRELSADLQRVVRGDQVAPVYVSRSSKTSDVGKSSQNDLQPTSLRRPMAFLIGSIVFLLVASVAGLTALFAKKPSPPLSSQRVPNLTTAAPALARKNKPLALSVASVGQRKGFLFDCRQPEKSQYHF